MYHQGRLFRLAMVVLALCVFAATPAMAHDNEKICDLLGVHDDLVRSKVMDDKFYRDVLKKNWKDASPILEKAYEKAGKKSVWNKLEKDLYKNWK